MPGTGDEKVRAGVDGRHSCHHQPGPGNFALGYLYLSSRMGHHWLRVQRVLFQGPSSKSALQRVAFAVLDPLHDFAIPL